jgi:hypothetical protein
MDMAEVVAAQDPRCTCGQRPHVQACRIEVERQQLAVALVLAARERMEERARGFRQFERAGQALRWYFGRVRRWSAPSSVQLEATGGSRSRTDDPRRLFAAIAYAIRAAEDDAAAREGERVPLSEMLAEHYGRGRSYEFIAEGSRGRFGVADVRRLMSRAHRVVRTRLEREGWIEGDGEEACT